MGKTQSFSLKYINKSNSRNLNRSTSSLKKQISKSSSISYMEKLKKDYFRNTSRNFNNYSLSSTPKKLLNMSQSVEDLGRTTTAVSFQLIDQNYECVSKVITVVSPSEGWK